MVERSDADWQHIGSLSHHSGFYQYFLAIPGVRKSKSSWAAMQQQEKQICHNNNKTACFWQHNKQARWQRDGDRNCNNGKKKKEDIISDLQLL